MLDPLKNSFSVWPLNVILEHPGLFISHPPTHPHTHTHTTLAIAANEVDDVRPVLDFYKSQGEMNILKTFKANQAKLREEEERMRAERERMAHRGTQQTIGGAIRTFSLRTFPHKEIGQDTSPLPDVRTSRLCTCAHFYHRIPSSGSSSYIHHYQLITARKCFKSRVVIVVNNQLDW